VDKRELDFLTDFLVNSDAIEGIENDCDKVRNDLEMAVSGDRNFLKGHAGALIMLRNLADDDSESELNVGLIKLVQLMIVREQPEKGERELSAHQIGEWRDREVVLVRTNSHGEILSRRDVGAKPEDIHLKMKILIGDVNNKLWRPDKRTSVRGDIRFVAQFHWRYERIHPFADGNGRSGRALVYFLYRLLCMKPFVFTNVNKHQDYYPCFVQNNSELMEEYFLNRFSAVK
jgi:hypothetical protein